jgi:hypothetical protein
MLHIKTDRSADPADIAFRQRALQTNSAIYARRHGPLLLPVLSGAGIRARYGATTEWLGSETSWSDADARRVGAVAAEIRRFGRSRPPEIAELCNWHADRLCELVNQHAALRRLEASRHTTSTWPDAASRDPRRRRRSRKSGPRS